MGVDFISPHAPSVGALAGVHRHRGAREYIVGRVEEDKVQQREIQTGPADVHAPILGIEVRKHRVGAVIAQVLRYLNGGAGPHGQVPKGIGLVVLQQIADQQPGAVAPPCVAAILASGKVGGNGGQALEGPHLEVGLVQVAHQLIPIVVLQQHFPALAAAVLDLDIDYLTLGQVRRQLAQISLIQHLTFPFRL